MTDARPDWDRAWAREGRPAVAALFQARFPFVDWDAHLRDAGPGSAYELWWRASARAWPGGRVRTDHAALGAGFARIAAAILEEVRLLAP